MSEPTPSTIQETQPQVQRVLATILRYGTWTSMAVIAVGVVILLARDEERTPFGHPANAAAALFHSPGGTIAAAGLIVLVATPTVRELTATVMFARAGNRFFAGMGVLILALIAVSILLGAH
jgi:uncharacterized membrane protein